MQHHEESLTRLRNMRSTHAWAVVLLLVTFFARACTTPIWRCPSFKLIPCKTLPRECTSYRMIYIRHVHLECPACLICADPWVLKPWAVIESTTANGATTKEVRRQRRRKLKKKVRRRKNHSHDRHLREGRRRKRRKQRQLALARTS